MVRNARGILGGMPPNANAQAGESAEHVPLAKIATGIEGLDEVLAGGIPVGRTTLVMGSTGTGKSVFGLQAAVAAVERGDPVVHVAFEEDRPRLVAHAAAFGWSVDDLERRGARFLDARVDPSLRRSGTPDLGGLLAIVSAHVREGGARLVVFDALDVLVDLMPTAGDARREIEALHAWLLRENVTAVVTWKRRSVDHGLQDHLPYLVDCVVDLERRIVEGSSERSVVVVKYRGSGYAEGAHPLLIGPAGLEVGAVPTFSFGDEMVSTERVSSGVPRLDAMLRGGYFRGASILVTGAPGTAKTTLAGAFAAAACARGERTLYVTFDSHPSEMIRNLRSVGIELAPHVEDGTLVVLGMNAVVASADYCLMSVRSAAERHGARCVVIDPLSAVLKGGSAAVVRRVTERFVVTSKARGWTLFCTSLLGQVQGDFEGSALQISTVADTWLHLAYQVRSGERNRTLSIVKSRGTGHSRQVRELVLSDDEIDLADVYTAGGEVLLGSLRAERERAIAVEASRRRDALERSLRELTEREASLALEQQGIDLARSVVARERAAAIRAKEGLDHAVDDERSAAWTERAGDLSELPDD